MDACALPPASRMAMTNASFLKWSYLCGLSSEQDLVFPLIRRPLNSE